jgi:cobyrinic acid a,c-diamide synthase
VIPRQKDLGALLPDRHLGLVTPEEHPDPAALEERLVSLGREHLDLEGLSALAQSAPALPSAPRAEAPPHGSSVGGPREAASSPPVEIGYFSDRAFTFYYPENLSALRAEGARLTPISALGDPRLPPVQALYLGGGFPETQAAAPEANVSLRQAVAAAARAGMPIYAECGGLMYLCRSLSFRGNQFEMAGVFPLDLVVEERPQGHGYLEALVDGENPFFARGTRLVGHEFHYSRVLGPAQSLPTAYAVGRGVGTGAGRDGLRKHQILARYLHLHALGTPEWAPGLVAAALRFKEAQGGIS